MKIMSKWALLGQQFLLTLFMVFVVSANATEMSSFVVHTFKNHAILEWTPASGAGNLSFHIWRAETKAGEYVQITDDLISEPAQGSTYSYEDRDAGLGHFYWYKLEDINGTFHFHGDEAVTGMVTCDSDNQPVEGMWVAVEDYETSDFILNASTWSDGNYLIRGLQAGSYRFFAYDKYGTYVTKFYDNAYAKDDAQKIEIATGQTISDINFSLPKAGWISGTVTRDLDAEPVEGIRITAYDDETGDWKADMLTESDGSYIIKGLIPGSYRIKCDAQNADYLDEYYDDAYEEDTATLVQVTADQITQDVNFSLAVGGKIEGVVRGDADGQPIKGLSVKMKDHQIDACQTDTDGSYMFKGLQSGTYTVEVNTEGTSYIGSEKTVHVTEGQTVSGTDFSLLEGVPVSGNVSEKANCQGRILVLAFSDDYEITMENIGQTDPLAESGVDESGDFELSLAPRENNIELLLIVSTEDENGQESITLVDVAQGIAVAPETDVTLNLGYEEYVRGVDVPNAMVFLQTHPENEFTGFTTADESGRYTFYNVPTGTYKIAAIQDGETIWREPPLQIPGTQGDINCDGEITLADAILAMTFCTASLLNPTAICKEADVNGDEKIGMEDLIFILQRLLNTVPSSERERQDEYANPFARKYRRHQPRSNGGSDPFQDAKGADVTEDGHDTLSVVLGDVDGDGDVDLITGNGRQSYEDLSGLSDLELNSDDENQPNRLYLNDGTSDPFKGGENLTEDAYNTRSLTLADIDGDSDLDLLAGNFKNQQNRLYLNNGTSEPFKGVAGKNITEDANHTWSLVVGDLDNDGDLDVIAGNYKQPNRLYLNDGTTDPFNGVTGKDITSETHHTRSLALGDVDNDGDLDLIEGNYDTQLNYLYLNNGSTDPFAGVTGKVIPSNSQTFADHLNSNTRSVVLGDVNGDGWLDMIEGNDWGADQRSDMGTNRLYLNNKTADPFNGVTGMDITSDRHYTVSLTLGDIDDDGDLDLVEGNNGTNYYYLNNGTATPFSDAVGKELTSDDRETRSVALGDVDGDGYMDLLTGNHSGQRNRLYRRNMIWWKFKTGDYVSSSPTLGTDGTVYVGSWDKHLYAVNPDRTLKWKYLTDGEINSSPAQGPDGTIYVGSWDKHLYAVNADGTLRWKYPTNGDLNSSPAVGSDGTVYVGCDDRYLYAIKDDTTNGTLKWKYKTGYYVNSSPAVGTDGTIYVGSDDRHLYAINADGTFKWKYRTRYYVSSSPVIGSDGVLYVGSSDKHLYAINADGTFKWKYKTDGYIYSSPATGMDGTIYVGSHDHHLHAVNPDGSPKWTYQTGDRVYSSPAIGDDGIIYVGVMTPTFTP